MRDLMASEGSIYVHMGPKVIENNVPESLRLLPSEFHALTRLTLQPRTPLTVRFKFLVTLRTLLSIHGKSSFKLRMAFHGEPDQSLHQSLLFYFVENKLKDSLKWNCLPLMSATIASTLVTVQSGLSTRKCITKVGCSNWKMAYTYKYTKSTMIFNLFIFVCTYSCS